MKTDEEIAREVVRPIGGTVLSTYTRLVRAGRLAVLEEVVEREGKCWLVRNLLKGPCSENDYTHTPCSYCWATARIAELGGEDGHRS